MPLANKCIISTLLNKTANIQNIAKYDEIMKFMGTNQEEICLYILNAAYQKVQEEPRTDLIDYISDINFCVEAAYQCAYFIGIRENATRSL